MNKVILSIKFALTALLIFSCHHTQNGVHSFGTEGNHETNVRCTNRFEFRRQLKQRAGTCEEIKKSNPMCAKNFTVAYSVHPPYVFQNEHENNKVQGILPDMLKFALESCCFGCNSVQFVGPFNHFDKFYRNADVVIPVQTSVSNSYFFGHDFIHMLEVQGVSFIGLPLKHDPDRMVRTIGASILNTYPLFIIAIVMAMTAGVAIWLLDTWWNESDFPNRFPRGPYEGFWWAFVSMTTVGYGDKSPKGPIARIFAVVWISVGITMFSMYTAALTSALTSAVIASHEISLYQNKIAVLNTTTIGQIAVLKENGVPIELNSIEEITHALKINKVDAIALDEHIANFYMEHIASDEGSKMTLYKRVQLFGSSYGAMTYKENVTEFFRSFFDSNDDQRETMAILTMEGHTHGEALAGTVSEVNDFFNSPRLMLITLIALVIITVVMTLLGLGIKFFIKRFRPKAGETEHDGEAMGLVEYGGLSKKDLEELADEMHTKIRHRIEDNINNSNHSEVKAF